jgi:hypothetical protein
MVVFGSRRTKSFVKRASGTLRPEGDLAGQPLTLDDDAGGESGLDARTMARYFWPGQDAIGQCIALPEKRDRPCTDVVGVVQNALQFRVTEQAPALYYLPLTHPAVANESPQALLVRAARGFPDVAGAVRREIQALASDMPYVGVQSYEELAPQLQPWRLGATMFTCSEG